MEMQQIEQNVKPNYGGLKPRHDFKRFEANGHRFYYGVVREGKKNTVKVLKGITSLLDENIPQDMFLRRWRENEENQNYFAWSAEYGTAVHYATYLYDLQDPQRNWYSFAKGLPYFDKIHKEVISWNNFRMKYETELQPLLLETPLYCNMPLIEEQYEEGGETKTRVKVSIDFCTTLDRAFLFKGLQERIVEIETGEVYKVNGKGFKKGELKLDSNGKPLTRKEVVLVEVNEIWIVDLKSNGKGVEKKTLYEGHGFQLYAQREAFKQNFPKITSTIRMFNFTSNEFKENRGDNTYNLTEWVISGESGNEETVSWDRRVLSQSDIKFMKFHFAAGAVRNTHIPNGYITEREEFHFGQSINPLRKISYEEYAFNQFMNKRKNETK